MPAECRVWIKAVSSPSRIQSVRLNGSPLSKTLWVLSEDEATANGAQMRPSYDGSENSWTPPFAIDSPILVPPPRLL